VGPPRLDLLKPVDETSVPPLELLGGRHVHLHRGVDGSVDLGLEAVCCISPDVGDD